MRIRVKTCCISVKACCVVTRRLVVCKHYGVLHVPKWPFTSIIKLCLLKSQLESHVFFYIHGPINHPEAVVVNGARVTLKDECQYTLSPRQSASNCNVEAVPGNPRDGYEFKTDEGKLAPLLYPGKTFNSSLTSPLFTLKRACSSVTSTDAVNAYNPDSYHYIDPNLLILNRSTLASFESKVQSHEGCVMLLWCIYIFLI